MRQPVYSKKDRNYRLVSRPNGLWRAEQHTGEPKSNTSDPWRPLCRDTSFAEANRHMPKED
jgi:hypothetical protein